MTTSTTTARAAATSATRMSRWRTWQWLYLVYLAVPLCEPLFTPDPPGWMWPLAIGIAVVTAVLYAVSVFWPEHSRWRTRVPMTVLGALATPLNPGAGILFVYAAANAGDQETRPIAVRWFGGLSLLAGVLCLVSGVPMPYPLFGLVPTLLFIWLIGIVQIENADRRRDAAELRLHNARVEHLATVAERERIARDLHDLLGHTLTAVVMRAQLTRELVERDPERAKAEAAEIERSAREALAQVRSTVTGWKQASLADELEAARTTLASAGVGLDVRWEAGLALLGSTEHALALALREAVTNVVRHAGARHCQIVLGTESGEVRLVVADDGSGGSAPEGNGLTGLRERITALGGRVARAGAPGTTLTIAVPRQVAT
jgi:two-component system, NarL family, sensor histidine kinase DesK